MKTVAQRLELPPVLLLRKGCNGCQFHDSSVYEEAMGNEHICLLTVIYTIIGMKADLVQV